MVLVDNTMIHVTKENSLIYEKAVIILNRKQF